MVTRREIIGKAAEDCMKELYSHVQPSVEWDDFVQQNKEYSKKYYEWDKMDRNKRPDLKEFCGPRPYEFYYLPKEVMKEITESYVHAYKMDEHGELVSIIEILKGYCKEPIVDKYIDDYTDEFGNYHPGHRSYAHPASLEKEITKLFEENKSSEWDCNPASLSEEVCKKFFQFLDMASEFYTWNGDINSFKMTVHLGPSPNSNKDVVIENWKKYKGVDITIDENRYKEEYDDEYFENDNEDDVKIKNID